MFEDGGEGSKGDDDDDHHHQLLKLSAVVVEINDRSGLVWLAAAEERSPQSCWFNWTW